MVRWHVFYRLPTVIDRSFPVRPSFFHGELISYFLKSLPKWVTGYFYRGRSVSPVLRRKFYLPRCYTKILGQPLSDAPPRPRSNDFLGQFPAAGKIMSTISAELREPRVILDVLGTQAEVIKLIIVTGISGRCTHISWNVSWRLPDEISLGFIQSDYSLIKYLYLMTLDLYLLHIISARIMFQFNRSTHVDSVATCNVIISSANIIPNLLIHYATW